MEKNIISESEAINKYKLSGKGIDKNNLLIKSNNYLE